MRDTQLESMSVLMNPNVPFPTVNVKLACLVFDQTALRFASIIWSTPH